MSFTLSDLIYSKQIKDPELQQRLLCISRSSGWVEDLIDLIQEMSENEECPGTWECESCNVNFIDEEEETQCQYKQLLEKHEELKHKTKKCPGTWDCENCNPINVCVDNEELCDYYKLKEEYKELENSVNEVTIKLKTKNNHYEEKFTRYAAIKEEKGPIETLEDEVEHFIEKEVDKTCEDLKLNGKKIIVGGVELPNNKI